MLLASRCEEPCPWLGPDAPEDDEAAAGSGSGPGDRLCWDDPASIAAGCLVPFVGDPVRPRSAPEWDTPFRGTPSSSSGAVARKLEGRGN